MNWADHFYISEQSRQLIIVNFQVRAMELYNIVQCGTAYARAEFDVARKQPSHHIVLFSIAGEGVIETPDCSIRLGANQVAYLPSDIPHRIRLATDHWDFCWLAVDNAVPWEGVLPLQFEVRDSENGELIRKTIECLHQSKELGYPLDQQLTNSQVEQLRLLVTHRLPSMMSPVQIRLKHVFQRVERQLHRDWSVTDLARLHPCSEAHFYRLCQTYFGCSPIAQLTKMRMEHAGRLLAGTNYPIQHICESVGYPNAANFSTRFRKWSSLSPSDYRKRFSLFLADS
uniref:helix-turn-helix transcriptional regulator n=1 Tax=Thaumasiovibrio occultus TaxID=1891184 RepID=UPI00131E8F9E|nr:AraC family transcriptional regulator [Thaumasiovibrio occultus]